MRLEPDAVKLVKQLAALKGYFPSRHRRDVRLNPASSRTHFWMDNSYPFK